MVRCYFSVHTTPGSTKTMAADTRAAETPPKKKSGDCCLPWSRTSGPSCFSLMTAQKNEISIIVLSDDPSSRFSSSLYVFFCPAAHIKPVVITPRWLFHFLLACVLPDIFFPHRVTRWLACLYRWNKSPGKATAAGSLGQLGNNLISTHLNPPP